MTASADDSEWSDLDALTCRRFGYPTASRHMLEFIISLVEMAGRTVVGNGGKNCGGKWRVGKPKKGKIRHEVANFAAVAANLPHESGATKRLRRNQIEFKIR
jgi:hypothetical protein